MEIKKSPKADLQNKKVLFTEIGLVIALAVMALAFWYHKSDNKIKVNKIVAEVIEMEEIDVTRQDDTPPPPPQQTQIQVITDVLNIVSNDKKIDSNITFIDESDDFDDLDIVIEEKEEEIEEEEIFVNAEVMPKFQGGGLKSSAHGYRIPCVIPRSHRRAAFRVTSSSSSSSSLRASCRISRCCKLPTRASRMRLSPYCRSLRSGSRDASVTNLFVVPTRCPSYSAFRTDPSSDDITRVSFLTDTLFYKYNPKDYSFADDK